MPMDIRKGHWTLGAGVMDGCEPRDMGAGNQIQILWANSKYSCRLSHLSRLTKCSPSVKWKEMMKHKTIPDAGSKLLTFRMSAIKSSMNHDLFF